MYNISHSTVFVYTAQLFMGLIGSVSANSGYERIIQIQQQFLNFCKSDFYGKGRKRIP